MNAITCRAATLDDLPTLAALRWEMQAEARDLRVEDEAAYIANYVAEMRGEFEQGCAFAWLATADGVAVAAVTLLVWVVPPVVGHPVRRRAQVSNVFTQPAYRRHGIARQLIRLLLDHARTHHVHRVVLWASEMGEPLYRGLSFGPGGNLRIEF